VSTRYARNWRRDFTFIKYEPKDCFSILHSFQWCSSANLEKLQVGWCFVYQEAATYAILVRTQLLDCLHNRWHITNLVEHNLLHHMIHSCWRRCHREIMRRNGEGEADNKKITGLQPKLNLRLGMSFLEIVKFLWQSLAIVVCPPAE
jgi:hypothetical protein